MSEHEQLFGRTGEQVATIDSFDEIPLTVIGASEADPRFGDNSQTFRQFWNEESRKLASKSGTSQFILAKNSSHHIHLDSPQLVIDTIIGIGLGETEWDNLDEETDPKTRGLQFVAHPHLIK